MNVNTGSATAGPPRALMARTRMWRASLGVVILLAIEAGLGMFVQSSVDVPKADHHAGLGDVISNGPVLLSIHAVVGLLLALGGLGLLVQSIMARHWGIAVLSVVGLLALAFASVAGNGYSTTGDGSASTAMAVMAGIALVCYVAILYILRPEEEPSR